MLIQLQYLRAIAALMVVYFHSILQFEKVDPSFQTSQYSWGEAGVDIFFVLSGFVMWLTTSGRAITPLEFCRRRIKRIVPLYWMATLFSASVALVAPSILKSTIFNLPHLVASLFFLPWINPADPTMIVPVVVPGWTLNYEMFFYAVFAFILLIPEKRRILAMCVAFALILGLCQVLPQWTAVRFYGQPLILEFLAGALIGWLYMEKILLPKKLAPIILAAGLILLVIIEIYTVSANRAYAWGIPAFFIVYAAVSMDFTKLPRSGVLSYLGDSSYAIYITHAFTLAFLRILSTHLSIGLLHNPVSFVILCLVLSSIFGAIAHEATTPRKRVAVAG